MLEYRWKGAGLDANPLGLQRDSADFHSLPMYTKAKLLQFMCESRLEMPDVEVLTKVSCMYALYQQQPIVLGFNRRQFTGQSVG